MRTFKRNFFIPKRWHNVWTWPIFIRKFTVLEFEVTLPINLFELETPMNPGQINKLGGFNFGLFPHKNSIRCGIAINKSGEERVATIYEYSYVNGVRIEYPIISIPEYYFNNLTTEERVLKFSINKTEFGHYLIVNPLKGTHSLQSTVRHINQKLGYIQFPYIGGKDSADVDLEFGFKLIKYA